ncbi:hypothetical protein RIR_jg22189.t1 [Rhizophagus irregularis DAOM 181602=DAOM 197198]|nr:hypothetical protein RIR_jg22189.t1 [Rhizophagus irregularis DAOM 181602=DAOM 197198]
MLNSVTTTSSLKLRLFRSNKTGKPELEKKQKTFGGSIFLNSFKTRFQTSFFGERYHYDPGILNFEPGFWPLVIDNGYQITFFFIDLGVKNFYQLPKSFDPDKMQKLNCFKVVFARKIKTTYNEK